MEISQEKPVTEFYRSKVTGLSIWFQFPKIWNALPDRLKNANSQEILNRK